MTSATSIGRQAEVYAADYLKAEGFSVLAKNWRTRFCEIDIVAQRDKTIYFVEVKYRSQYAQGDGLAYITAKKYNRLKFAASLWIAQNNWAGDWRLAALSVKTDGLNYLIDDFVELE